MLLNGYHIHSIIICVLKYKFLQFCQKNDKIQQNTEMALSVDSTYKYLYNVYTKVNTYEKEHYFINSY